MILQIKFFKKRKAMKSDKFTDTTLEKDPNFVNGTATVFSPKKKNKNNQIKRVYNYTYGCQSILI